MAGNTLAWTRAMRVLGLQDGFAEDGWLRQLHTHHVARLQLPDGTSEELATLCVAMEADARMGRAQAYMPPRPEWAKGRETPDGLQQIWDAFYASELEEMPHFWEPSAVIQWLEANGEPPSAHIRAWADAGGIEPELSTAPTGDESTRRNHVDVRHNALEILVREIERHAIENDFQIKRSEWPGTKNQFRDFVKCVSSRLAYRLPSSNDRLSDDLKKIGITFLPGNNKSKGDEFYNLIRSGFPK